MNVSALVVFLSWISMVFGPTQAEGRNRELYFPAYYFFAERRLMNHTIKTKPVENLDDCEYLCYLDDNCVSLNIQDKNLTTGTHECELNNSTHLEHGADLVNDTVFYYRGAKNFCGIKNPPCKNNAICQSGFTDKGYRCLCNPGFQGEHCEQVSKNCADTYKAGERESGVYTINPDGSGIFHVFCDQTTAGGGWLVFQKRLDGSVDFYRGWTEYKSGFGNLTGEFWLGLDKIHRLTSKGSYRLRVDLEDFAGKITYAEYDLFKVASEGKIYELSVGSYAGTAGDKLRGHNGHKFSTKDQDNDAVSTHDCAKDVKIKGAWWFYNCRTSNLNGVYRNATDNGTIVWGGIRPIKRAEMKIRPIEF